MSDTNKEKERSTIKQILHSNKYDTSLIIKFTPVENKIRLERKDTMKTKEAKFTYIGKETKFVTKLFKNYNLKISFTTQNTIGKLLTKHKNG